MAKLLIIDDEVDVLEMTSHYFRKRGVDVLTADNGNEAVRIIADDKPDLVLLDFNLPDITGAEVLRKIREELESEVKVIIVTGADEEHIKKEVGNLKIFRYLHKPLTLDALEKIVLAELTT